MRHTLYSMLRKPYFHIFYFVVALKSRSVPLISAKTINLDIGNELLCIRSSDIAFTMGAKGPLLEKAHNYNGNIERY